MAVGTWNGTTFSKDDLDAIVASFEALGLHGRVPLKIGHEADHESDNAPALGWVDRLYRQGDKLVADFASVPQKLYDAIKEGLYKFVSVELLGNVKASTQTIPWVLDAVAILGATRPAVGILKDLQSLTLARRPVLRAGSRVRLRREFNQHTEVNEMDETQVKALVDKAVGEVTAKFSSQVSDLTTKLSAATEQAKAEAEARKKLEISTKRNSIIAKFDREISAGTLLPKYRESFKKMAGVDDDTRVMAIADELVDDYIKDNRTPGKKPVVEGKVSFKADDEEGIEDATKIVAMRVRKIMLSRNQDLGDVQKRVAATAEVLKQDAALAEAYKLIKPYTAADAA